MRTFYRKRAPLCLSAFYIVVYLLALFCERSAGLPQLHAADFNAILSNYSVVVAHFYAPGCSRCADTTSLLEAVNTVVLGSSTDIHIAETDITLRGNADLPAKFNVLGFPSVKLIYQPVRAEVHRLVTRDLKLNSADGVVDQIRLFQAVTRMNDGAVSLEVTSAQLLQQLLQDNAVLLGMFPQRDENSDEFTAFSAAALQMRNPAAVIAHTFDESVVQAVQQGKCCSDQVVVLTGAGGGQRACANMSQGGLMHCLLEPKTASIIDLNGDAYANQKLLQLMSEPATILFTIFRQDHLELPSVRSAMEVLAAELQPIRLALVDATRHGKLLRNWNLTAAQLPAVILYNTETMGTSVGVNVEVDGMRDWLSQQQAGDPSATQGRPCVSLEAAMKGDAPFVLHGYLPWCSTCKYTREVLAELTGVDQDPKASMKVVDVDASNCTLPYSLQVARYPALFLVHPSGCQAVRFSAEFNKESVQTFWQSQINGQSGANYVDGVITEALSTSCNSSTLLVVDTLLQ